LKPRELIFTGGLLWVDSDARLELASWDMNVESPTLASDVTSNSRAANTARRFEILEFRFPVSLIMMVSAFNIRLGYRVL